MIGKKTVAITISANSRRLKADMRRATGEVRAFERQVSGVAQRMKRMRMNFMQSGIFGRGGGALRTAAGFAGVFGFQQMLMDAKNLDAALTDVAITGNLSASKLGQLKKQMFDVSNATGKSTTEVLSFVQAMTTATGDTGSAMVALKGIGEVAVATGTDMGSLGDAFVKMTTSMKILPREARQAFNILRSQEKMGSVTMAQMAAVLPEVVGGASFLGKSATGLKGITAIGGLMQIARRGTGTVDMAKTGTEKFMQNLFLKRKMVKKRLGVDIMGADGNVRNLADVFGEIGVALNKGKAMDYAKAIFGDRGIRVAMQLKDAGKAGLGSKIGTFQSYNAIMGAGKTDEIGADAARRRKSASYQFGAVLNRLKNTLQKFALPVFKQLSKTLTEFGPDLVKALKFILENSRSLLKLWLGWKGVQFFKNLVKAGSMGAPGGMGGGMGPGFMTSAGHVIPAASPAGGAMGGPSVLGGERANWRSAQAVQGFGVNRLTDQQMLRRERSLRNRVGRSVGGAGAWLAGTGVVHSGALMRGGGMAVGMMGMMGKGPMAEKVGPAWADMASNMALMSGNPYAMAAALLYKKGGGLVKHSKNKDGSFSFSKFSERFNMGENLQGIDLSKSSAVQKKMQKMLALRTSAVNFENQKYSKWRAKTPEGAEHGEEMDVISAMLGFGRFEKGGGDFMFDKMKIAGLGMKGAGALRSRLQSRIGVERGFAAAKLRADNREVTEENLRQASPAYAKMSQTLDMLNETMTQMRSGKWFKLNVIAKVDPNGVATRLDESGGVTSKSFRRVARSTK